MNVQQAGQVAAVFARIAKEWGRLDFLVHSIASAPKEMLRGRVVDASRDGFLQTMDMPQSDAKFGIGALMFGKDRIS